MRASGDAGPESRGDAAPWTSQCKPSDCHALGCGVFSLRGRQTSLTYWRLGMRRCWLWLAGLWLIGCGQQDDHIARRHSPLDGVTGTPCTLGTVGSHGCPPTESTNCGLSGGGVSRSCIAEQEPTDSPGEPWNTHGTWSPCCCFLDGETYCGLEPDPPPSPGTFTCGNGQLDPGEACDWGIISQTCESFGFAGGMLGCTATCTWDFSMCTQGLPPSGGAGA